jgi:hypothetical protein
MSDHTSVYIIVQGWYNAKILSRTGNVIRVHYMNWSEKFDSDILIDDVTLIPYTARTKEHASTKKKKSTWKTPSDIGDSEENSGDTGDTGDTTEDLSMTSLDESPGSRLRLLVAEREMVKEQQRNKLKERELELETLTRGSRSSRASLTSPQGLKDRNGIKHESSSSSMDIPVSAVEEGDSDVGTDITGEGKTISTLSSNGHAVKLESESECQQIEKIPKLLNGREYGAGTVRVDDVCSAVFSDFFFFFCEQKIFHAVLPCFRVHFFSNTLLFIDIMIFFFPILFPIYVTAFCL